MGSLDVEYAICLRVEFIPEGAQIGPVEEIYFKVLKAGSSSIVGCVLGWPNLDVSDVKRPPGECLGLVTKTDGFYYQKLGVLLPRLDAARKLQYQVSLDKYVQTEGQSNAVKRKSVRAVEECDLDCNGNLKG